MEQHGTEMDIGNQDYSEWWHEVKVIGNKFDNPELLEGNND